MENQYLGIECLDALAKEPRTILKNLKLKSNRCELANKHPPAGRADKNSSGLPLVAIKLVSMNINDNQLPLMAIELLLIINHRSDHYQIILRGYRWPSTAINDHSTDDR